LRDGGNRLPGLTYFEDSFGFWGIGCQLTRHPEMGGTMGVKAKLHPSDGTIILGGYYGNEWGAEADYIQHSLFLIEPCLDVRDVFLRKEVSTAAGEGVLDKLLSVKTYLMYSGYTLFLRTVANQ
jgi:hypothetical protein